MKKLLLVSLMCTGIAEAGTMGPSAPEWHWVSAISAGPAWTNPGQQQTFFLTPDIVRTYTTDNSTDTIGNFELFFGVQHTPYQNLLAQWGLAVAGTTDATPSGIIWDDADPLFDNYSYRYKIQHTHIAAKGKLMADMGYMVMPYVSGSIGVGFNTAHGYNDTPLIPEAVDPPNFRQHTETTFTYTVGAGLQKAITDRWQVGAGYEFADWGKSNLARAPGQTLNTGPELDHLYTHALMFNLTFVA